MIPISLLELSSELRDAYLRHKSEIDKIVFIEERLLPTEFFDLWEVHKFTVKYQGSPHTVWTFADPNYNYKVAFDACPPIDKLPTLTKIDMIRKIVKTLLEIIGVEVKERNSWDTYYPAWIDN
jgi:hypothetical protein